MKALVVPFGCKLVLTLTVLLSAHAAPADDGFGESPLQNGNFESGLDFWTAPSTGVTIFVDQSEASDGEGFVKVSVPPERTMSVSQEITGLEPGRKYRVTARIRKNTSEDARFIVRDVATSKYLTYRTLDVPDVWTPVEMSFTSPIDGGAVSIEFNFRSPGTCEIDEVSLEDQG